MGILDNQRAVVFGGSGFIGSAVFRTLALHGAQRVVRFVKMEQEPAAS